MNINWDAVGAIAESLSGLGVIATLAYLAYQIHQNTRFMRADMYQRINESYVSVNLELFRDADSIEFLLRVEDTKDPLSAVDERRFRLFFNAGICNSENAFQQLRMGTLSYEQVDIFVTNLNRHRWMSQWQSLRPHLDPDFVEFMESRMA